MSTTNACPIVVVGQPRSGSTILTRLLNANPDLFIVNDFYVLQKVAARGLWGALSPDEAGYIAAEIYRILEIRCAQEVGVTLEQSVHLSLEDLAALRDIATGPWQNGLHWHDVLQRLMTEAAHRSGATRWGWNTPQDHLNLARIYEAFPDARVICQLRNPLTMLRSYKNVWGWWHDARRYNPVILAMAWRKAARAVRHWQEEQPDSFMFVRFEDLVHETQPTAARLTQFMAFTTPLPDDLQAFGRNSSLTPGQTVKPVTGLEARLARYICGTEAHILGFDMTSLPATKVSDIVELARVSIGSAHLLITGYLFNADRRARLVSLLRRG